MKVTIEFDTDEHPNALYADELFEVLNEIRQYLRTQVKHHDHEMTQEEFDAVEKIQTMLHTELSDRGLWKLFS